MLAEIPKTQAMGPVMFLLVPFAAGFAIAMVTRTAEAIFAATLLATIGSLAVLIATRMETPLCAVLALPLLFVGLMSGVALAYVSKREMNRSDRGGTIKSIVFWSVPLLVFAGHRIELSTLVHPRQEVVTSSIWLPEETGQVWANLRSFDSLTGEKPALMYIGLPIHRRCTMEGSGLGAKRTCYFDRGYIEETVTEWLPPTRMRLSIDRTSLPGRHWLGFEDAEYDLRSLNGGTFLTRRTSIISNLYPVWYWRPFERWGVASEHRYILNDLALRARH
jgi:hypothetical protein